VGHSDRECHHIIGNRKHVYHVSFSPTNPQYLLSICGKKLWQWDINGHQIPPPYDGSHVAFSSDGTQFVSCNGAVVTVQNSDSGAIVAEFHVAKVIPMLLFLP
jgi:WD40 repeat protein